MGSIPGPIISFRFSGAEFSGAVQPAFQQVRDQARNVSNQIADDWKRMAAQIRASVAQGIVGDKEIVAQRTQLLSILDRQISGYNKLNELSVKELSTLKAVTLERERQANAIKTGTVGVTAGTNAALGQASQQAILGIGRVLDSLVNRYLGGAAGAAFRTARDVQYYSAQAGGGDAGILGGLTSGISPAVLAIGGLGVALTAIGVTAGIVTKEMLDTAQAINNVAAATGLSTTQVQEYNQIAKEMGLDAGTITNTFARLQAQIGEYITKGKSAEESTQAFIKVLTSQGVAIKNSDGGIRDINEILGDFYDKLSRVSDAGTRTALTLEALGPRGKVVAQIFNQAALEGKTFRQVLDEQSKSGNVWADFQVQDLQRAKTKWDEWERSASGALKSVGLAIAEFTVSGNKGGILAEILSGKSSAALGDILSGGFTPSAKAGPLDAGFSAVGAFRARQAKELNDSLIDRAEIIRAGGRAQYDLTEAEKNYSNAVKESHGEDAKKYADQIASLKAVIELQKQSAEEHKRFTEFLLNPGTGSLAPGRERRSVQDLIGNLLNPGQGGAPDIGIGSAPSTTNYLAGIVGPAGKSPLNAADLLAQINKEHEDLFRSQASIDAEHYQDELDSLNEALKKQLISQKEYNDAVVKLAQDRNKTLNDADKKYEDEAGGLFEDLISGKTKEFSQKLLKDVEDIALGPVKKLFEQLVGGQLQSLADLFSGKKTSGGGSGSLGGVWTTLKNIWSGKTPGFFPGSTGSVGGVGGAGGPGQTAVGTMNVAAQVVYLTTLGVAQTGGGGGLGNFFGANSLLGGFGNFFGNLNPFGPSGVGTGGGATGASGNVSLLTKVLGQASPFAAGAAALGLGLATGNESTIAIGAAALAGKAATALSGISSLPAGLSGALGTFGQAAPGLGILASGIINADQSRTTAGKLGGTLEAGAGGALTGLILGGPIGAAIGGAVGLIGGAVASIFGGGPQGFQQSVQYAMAHNQYHAPLSENFSFASNGSIASTLGTGFQQNGSSFSQYALPSNTSFQASALTGDLTWQQLYQLQNSGLNPNAPFLGNPSTNPYIGQGPVGSHATPQPTVAVHVNLPGYIDAQGASAALTPHATLIAQIVSKQLSNSSSGFSSSVRNAAYLP